MNSLWLLLLQILCTPLVPPASDARALDQSEHAAFVHEYLKLEHASAALALQLAREAEQRALDAGDTPGATIARALGARALAISAGPNAARPLIEADFDDLHEQPGLEAVVLELSFAKILTLQGHFGRALDILVEMRERTDRVGSATIAFHRLLLEFEVRFETDSLADPFEMLDDMRARTLDPELAHLDAWSDHYRQWFLYMEGHVDEAAELCRQVSERARETGDRYLLSVSLYDLGLESWYTEEEVLSHEPAELALEAAVQGSFLEGKGYALELLANYLLGDGRLDEAEVIYERLRREVAGRGLPGLEALIVDLGRDLAAARGDAETLLALFRGDEGEAGGERVWLELIRARGQVNQSERASERTNLRLAREARLREEQIRHGLAGALAVAVLLLSFIVASRWRLRKVNERLQQEMKATEAAESSRQASERRLQQLQRLRGLGVMAGGVAHDFNNLLTGVIGNADLLIASNDLSPEQRRRVNAILDAGERGAALCKRLLVYAGKLPASTDRVDLNHAVVKLLPMLEAVAGTVRLEHELSQEIALVKADPTRVDQVLLNLVANAREAGAQTIKVRVEVEPESVAGAARRLVLSVEDDGIGMDEEVREHLFEPFFTTRTEGHGLGLAEVFGIVEELGGQLEVESAPDEGSRFKVRLPLATDPRPDSSKSPLVEAAQEVPAAGGTQPATVLVVDDEHRVRELVSDSLRSFGMQVIAVSSGEEALEYLQDTVIKPTCILLDVMMPGLSGHEVLSELRRRGQDLPVVLMSGYHSKEIGSRIAGEPPPMLHKPFRSDELRQAIDRVLC